MCAMLPVMYFEQCCISFGSCKIVYNCANNLAVCINSFEFEPSAVYNFGRAGTSKLIKEGLCILN